MSSGSAAQRQTASGVADLERSFLAPPDDSRIMMRWWWFGPAVTTAELEREMRLMKEGGIGGFEVQPVYPVVLDDDSRGIRTLPFLSDGFLDALRFVSERARALGLRMDLTLGSGWPFGGPDVSIAHAAGRLRVERLAVAGGARRVPLPSMGSGERLIGAFLARVQDQAIVGTSLREIGDVADGVARLPADLDGPHQLLVFIAGRTGMMVKRPAIGGEGFVLNHYDRAAVDRYLERVGDRLMQAFGGDPPYAIFCDSLEAYGSDWTDDFLEQFQRRRGYDLRPHLAALAADVGPETRAVRYDWGRTLTELVDERFLAPVQAWAARHRTRFRAQVYGVPPATISSGAHADLPEGEGSEWRTVSATRWAASASHLYGQPVTSSETWTWLHSPVFRATPLDLKAEADLHFLQGVNQLVGHGWPYSPEGVGYPGWSLYAAGVYNEKNPWWIAMPDLARSLQRVSFMLRQGQPVADVAFYLPVGDGWADITPGRAELIAILRGRVGPDVVGRVLEAGVNLDFFDDRVLATIGRVESGALVLGPNRYRAVVMPAVERIPLATWRTLEAFARGGGVLVATRRTPALAPGFLATDADHAEVREIARRLFEGPSPPATFVEDENRDLARELSARLRPDVALAPRVPEIGFVHRRTPDADVYFVANTSNVRQRVQATFRLDSRQAEWWDPISGAVSRLETRAEPGGGLVVPLDLPPYGSGLVVFTTRVLAKPAEGRVPPRLSPIDLSSGWQVTFGAGRAPIAMDQLRSWTDDEETRGFSGVAIYEKSFTIADEYVRPGLGLSLDFGDGRPLVPDPKARHQAWLDAPIREAAVVYMNGQRAGSVWSPPYLLDVSRFARRGTNTLRIEVGNLAINHMAARALPDYRLLNLRYGVRFEPQDMDKVQPVPSGLLGPIQLKPGT
jgi:hypothetical protein